MPSRMTFRTRICRVGRAPSGVVSQILFARAIHQAPVLFAPGTRYAYSNPGMAALAYAVTASLKGGDLTQLS